MLTEPDQWEWFFDDAAQKNRQRIVAGLSVTAKQMVKDGGFEISSLGGRFADENRSREIDSIISTADTQTRWLLSRMMREDLKGEEFGDMKKKGVDFRQLKQGSRPMTVYVVLPSKYLQTHSIWLRLIVSDALRASLVPGGRRTLFILDEMPALGHLPILEKMWAVTRDYRVTIAGIFQDLPLMQRLYPQSWETLLGMAGVVQSFRAANQTTAEWLSKRAGSTTVVAAAANEGRGISAQNAHTNMQSGITYQQVQRPFILPEQTFGMPEGAMLCWLAGEQRAIQLFAPHYKKINSLKDLALPNPYFQD